MFLLRPDAYTVWRDEEVNRRLRWYKLVMLNKRPAKFLIAKEVEAGYDLKDLKEMGEGELWRLHDSLRKEFLEKWEEYKKGGRWPKERSVNFIHVKAELAKRLMSPCRLCERRCNAKRAEGRWGSCLVDDKTYVHSAFLHMGEEAPLVPSGTIFYGGCPFKCVFCQNWDISQTSVRSGKIVDAKELALIQKALRREGARNINHVGGDPIPSAPTIIESLIYLDVNVPQLWNSNMYMTEELLNLLLDIIDIWLPDFKYGNNKCAMRLSYVRNYWEVVTRNLKRAAEHGDMIIRHLVLPNHLECCTKPVLEWIAKNLKDKVLVNIMEQYRPEHLVARFPERWPDIARRVSWEEVMEAREYASKLGLVWEPVS